MKAKMITLRLSEEEYRILMSRAVRRGESLSDYLRWVLLRQHGKNKNE